MAEFIVMYHPDGRHATCTREAFDKVWKSKGWTLTAPAVDSDDDVHDVNDDGASDSHPDGWV